MTKKIEDQIASIQEKKKQLEAREKQLKARANQKERKERTRRLIKIGGAVESVYGKAINDDQITLLVEFLNQQNKRGNYFNSALDKTKENN